MIYKYFVHLPIGVSFFQKFYAFAILASNEFYVIAKVIRHENKKKIGNKLGGVSNPKHSQDLH
jgi:hypothetical protein